MKTKPVKLTPIEEKYYCWFCATEIPTEEVFIQTDKESLRFGQTVYRTSWGTIHSARKEHYKIKRNY